MALFCAAIRRESISLGRFFLFIATFKFSRVACLLPKISIRLYFSPFFQVNFVLLILLSVLSLIAVICLSSRFSMSTSSRYIDASMLSSKLAHPFLPSFLDTNSGQCHFWDVRPYASLLFYTFESFSHHVHMIIFHWR